MRIFLPFVAALALAGTATPALAQDALPGGDIPDADFSEVTDRLSDPAFQQDLAVTVATLSQVLLDLPIAPLAQAAADMAGDVSGEEPRDIDPDLTIRKVAPEAADVPQVIERELPQAMARMGDMAGAMEAMLPALLDMARQMEGAVEGIEIR